MQVDIGDNAPDRLIAIPKYVTLILDGPFDKQNFRARFFLGERQLQNKNKLTFGEKRGREVWNIQEQRTSLQQQSPALKRLSTQAAEVDETEASMSIIRF